MRNCVDALSNTWNMRDQFLQRDLAYYREVDTTTEQNRALWANRTGDPRKLQNLIIPIIMPQVESALAYNAGVFLTGYPIFGVAADPAKADAALQLETILSENQVQYAWVRHMIMFLRDTLKYNFGALEVTWKKRKVYSLVNDPSKSVKQGTSSELWYQGNSLRRLDPYNMIWDKRVMPTMLHTDGEFAGYTELMSRVQLKQYLLDCDPELTMNAKKAFESGTPSITINGADSWYCVPQINPNAFRGLSVQNFPTTNWLAWMVANGQKETDIRYHDMYEVTTLYGRIIPSDFSFAVPQRNQPQIWKFVIVNRQVPIYVERQTNAHNLLPILIGQAIEDGLGYQTKSFADNAEPFQAMTTALWNSAIASKRRQVFDRIYYDPSRIRKEDIDRVTEVARIPVKQSAYGKPVSDAVHSSPYNDTGVADTLQMASQVNAMADESNGQNKVQRGQFQKGNKTKTEFTETMSSANSRQQIQALGIENQVMIPIKEVIKINTLQYQSGASIYSPSQKKLVVIKPEELRDAALTFKISDGILPTDKLLSTDLLQVFMQTIQTSPLMQSEFNMVEAFVYWCKMQGAQWLEDFRRSPDEQKQVMAQLSAFEQAKKGPPQAQGAEQQQQSAPGAA